MKILLGTRGSALALLQTRRVADSLRAAQPGLLCEIVEITTHGDQDAERPLPEIGGEGLFTRRIESALREGSIDAAVHSLKDLPVVDPEGLTVGAVIGREEARDVLVARDGLTLAALPFRSGGRVQQHTAPGQLLARRPDLVVKPIRGNVETRIAKVQRGEFDATILAGAGIVRLGLTDRITEWIPLADFLPAPGQGAIAVQCRTGDQGIARLLAAIDEPALRAATDAERLFLRLLGAGCSAPVGAFAAGFPRLRMTCRVSAPDGSRAVEVEGEGSDPRLLAETLAARALRAGADAVLAAAGKKDRLVVESALRGKRVLVTRAREQAAGLCAELSARGAVPVFLPMIRIEPSGDTALLDEALRALSTFTWILFTSANAVELVSRRAAALGIALAGPKIAAVGPATADALSALGLPVDCTPAEHTAAALAEAVCGLEPEGVGGARILLPRAEGGREEAAALLRGRGADVHDIVVYRTRSVDVSRDDMARLAPGVDAILFTSGSTVRAWCEHALSFPPLSDAARGAAIACIGPSTREAAAERGLAVAVTPEEHTTRGLVAALERHFARAGRSAP